jgi:hypothetical protein
LFQNRRQARISACPSRAIADPRCHASLSVSKASAGRPYPPSSYFGLVIIDRPENATVPDVVRLVDRLLNHGEFLSLVGP